MDNIFNWQGYEWLTQERWGQHHIERPAVWYDSSAVVIAENDYMSLKCRPNSKIFINDGVEISVPVGIGLVSCTTPFGYGKFEICAKLPNGPYVWPAFWMWSFDSWPPEIDVFEGYTNKRKSYFNWNWQSFLGRFWAVNSNVHLGLAPKNYMLGGKSHWLGWKKPSSKFNKYGCIWTDKEITILFNDKVVRKITDKKTLDQFKDKKMNVIINNSVQENYLRTSMPEHEMIVKYFTYEPIN